MISILLGAGFSKWAAGLPVASELFDFAIEPISKREEVLLSKIKLDKGHWDEIRPQAFAEEFIAWMIGQSDQKKARVAWYVTRRLSEHFIAPIWGSMQTYMIDERRAAEHDGVKNAKRLLTRFIGLDSSGILTTNYDLLIEYALSTKGFNYGTRGEPLKGRNKNPLFFSQGGPVSLHGELPLAKLHGSVSWDSEARYTDGRCGIKGSALIVPPVAEKTMPWVLRNQWDLARQILQKSEKLLVFGFAFNPYDRALLDMLLEAGGNLRKVLLVDPKPNVSAASFLWPRATILTTNPPPLPDFRWGNEIGIFDT